MCGITGSLNWTKPDSLELIRKMTHVLSHRGPDREKVLPIGPIILGHRRLSIIDLHENSDQPLSIEEGRFWIVFNGEIYNYQELRQDLEQLGEQFHTRSDTEVILRAYKNYGAKCLNYLVGMFAFAIWDNVEQILFLARDRLGEKPLYYHMEEKNGQNNIIFASELKALMLHPALSKKINPTAINQFLSLNYILNNCSILESVKKLPPAHYLLIKKNASPILKPYWQLKDAFLHKKNYKNIQEAVDELQELLHDSVKHQTISDVPLGAFLSGGR